MAQQKRCSEMGDNDIQFTYDMFNQSIEQIILEIMADRACLDLVLGIARGGMIPAVVLSHRLKIPFGVIDLKTYHIDPRAKMTRGSKILVVDDIADSGNTIRDIKLMLPECRVATLIVNTDQNIGVPDYSGTEIERNTDKRWVKFWWEK